MTSENLISLMQPALRWASYLLIFGFLAASCTSADHFGLLSCTSAHILATSRTVSVAFPRFGLAFPRLGLAFPRFSHFSAFDPYCSFGYSQEQRSPQPGTCENNGEASRATAARQRGDSQCAASLSIGCGLDGKANASLPEVSTRLRLYVYKERERSQFSSRVLA
jgi:hypothetical protein